MSDEHNTDTKLAEIEATLRDLDIADLEPVAPPADLWDRIADELGDETEAGSPIATVTTLSSWRERMSQPRNLLLVAAACAIFLAGVVAIGFRGGDDTTVVARADLGYDAAAFDRLGENASASVELIDDEGALSIAFATVDLPATVDEPADLELWLIETDDEGGVADLVSLGIIDATDRTFRVPAGYDPDVYSVVDISVEPRDGDAQHSGRSILRGQLSA